MVFLAGPRQCGKTTLAKSLFTSAEREKTHYFNWDASADREKILRSHFPTEGGLLVLDEIHKYSRWRNLLKGLFDKRGKEFSILVSGSAKLDFYRRGGDSLQGRYYLLRLHPLTWKEISDQNGGDFGDLLQFGGFPEPFFSKSEAEARIWSRDYRTRIVREELRELENVSEIGLVEHLALRLPELVGNPLSINSLREDLGVSHPTVSRWITILERLYAIFRVYPFGSDRIRAVKKEAKHYHFDWNQILEPGARFENLIACHLLKWCHFQEDTEGWEMELRYFRDVDKREVDFVILRNRKPIAFIEAKVSDTNLAPGLRYLHDKFPSVPAIQVMGTQGIDDKTLKGIRIVSAEKYLLELV